jgi:hypothetical protein
LADASCHKDRIRYTGEQMWVIDIRHFLDDTQTGPAVPRLKFKVKKLSEIITYATSVAAGIPVDQTPKCWRRPERKPCEGHLDIGWTRMPARFTGGALSVKMKVSLPGGEG